MPYKIGSTEPGMTDLASLATPVEYPKSKEEFQPYARYVKLGDGKRRGFGLPRTRWVWPTISQEERDQLRTFFPSGVSDAVYLSTRLPDDSFEDFVAIGHWPEDEPVFGGGYFYNFAIEFTDMEAL